VRVRKKKLFRTLALVVALLLAAGAVIGLLALIRKKPYSFVIGPGDWPMEGQDPAHRALVESGPQRPLEEAWNVRLREALTAPPAVADNRLFMGGKDGILNCLNTADGLPFWEFDAGSEILATPSIQGERVYFGTGAGDVFALDVKGREIWRRELGDSVTASTLPVGERLFAGSQDDYLYCLDIETGEVLWRYATGGPVDVAPCAAGGYVFCLSSDGTLYTLKEKSGELVWQFKSGGDFDVTCSASEGRLYVLTEFDLRCLDIDTGKEVWAKEGNSHYWSNLAIRFNQVIYVRTKTDASTVIDSLDTRTGDEVWMTGSPVMQERVRIATSSKEVYVASTEGIYSYSNDADSGGLALLEQKLRGVLPQTLTVTSDAIYVATENFKIYCFRHAQ
jgi:eukaryotic-like serine/threonine-protein kinase